MTGIFSGAKFTAMWKMCVKALNVKTEAASSFPIFSTSDQRLRFMEFHTIDLILKRGLLYTTSHINTYKYKKNSE